MPDNPVQRLGMLRHNKTFLILTFGFLIISFVLFIQLLFTAPTNTAYPVTIQVERGTPVRDIATLTKEVGLVRSELLFYVILTGAYDPTTIHAGRYQFNEPMPLLAVAQKIATNQVDELLLTITIPEGMSAQKIADIASKILPDFDSAEYLSLAEGNEGYLYPETYFVPESFTASDLYTLQSKTFSETIRPIESTMASSTLEPKEIISLASIIEREANDETSMKMVSGILQNRLAIGMPLQADATIEYVIDTPLHELRPGELAQNLREIDSPYNTYKYTGLPPTPIGNPGLVAINAVIIPTPSDYFYYITGTDGEFYYAKTLDEHNNNVARYLR